MHTLPSAGLNRFRFNGSALHAHLRSNRTTPRWANT